MFFQEAFSLGKGDLKKFGHWGWSPKRASHVLGEVQLPCKAQGLNDSPTWSYRTLMGPPKQLWTPRLVKQSMCYQHLRLSWKSFLKAENDFCSQEKASGFAGCRKHIPHLFRGGKSRGYWQRIPLDLRMADCLALGKGQEQFQPSE